MRSLRTRLAVLAAVVLAVSLALSAALATAMLQASGQERLDEALGRELNRFVISVSAYSAERAGAGAAVTEGTVRAAVDDYFRFNPGSASYLTLVTFGDRQVISPQPPPELAGLSVRLAIPANTADGYETLESPVGALRSVRAPITLDGVGVGSVQVVGPMSDVRGEAAVTLLVLAGVAVFSLLAGGGALWFTVFRSLSPLRTLADAAARITNLDDLAERVPEPARRDEVGLLARQLNTMLDRLGESAHAQTEFLARVSHELRTPVTIARGHLEVLRAGGWSEPERATRSLSVVDDELDRLSRLVEDLFALARARLRNFVAFEDVDLPTLYADIELRLSALHLPEVEVVVPPEAAFRADPTRLAQAVLNLVRNAVTHTPAGTRVVVDARVSAGEVTLAVTDDGPGIDPAIVDRVLEPLVRGARGTGRGGPEDSSGLGLAVVDEVARAHGGRVTVESSPQGTTVCVHLPRFQADGAPPPVGSGAPSTGTA